MPPECNCLRAALPRLALQDDLSLLLLSAVAQPLAALLPYGCGTPLAGAALPILQKCAVIPVYRQSPQCGERSNAAFGTQSAAKQTSLAPHDSKARLQNGHDSQGFMAKPCTPHLHCAARAALRAPRGSRGSPLAFLWGFQRGYSLWKENTPFAPRPHGSGTEHRALWASKKRIQLSLYE